MPRETIIRRSGESEYDLALRKFLSGIDINAQSGCWEWKKNRTPKGYGQVWAFGRMMVASRLSYKLFVGDIPENLCACHICDNPPCCNPDHLFLGTLNDNIQDCIKKGRRVPHGKRGQDCGRAKLNDRQVLEIKRRSRDGEKAKDLGMEYGVDRHTIRGIVRGFNWNHIILE